MNRNREKQGRRLRDSFRLTATVVIAFFASFFLCVTMAAAAEQKPETAPVAGPHKELECGDCHGLHGAAPVDKTGKPCLECHEDSAGEDSHPTNIPHEGEPPEGLPLSDEGRITCFTCHVLHEAESSGEDLLRKEFDALCMTCHFPSETPGKTPRDPE